MWQLYYNNIPNYAVFTTVMWLIVLLGRRNIFSYPNNRLSDVTVFRIPQWLFSKESACKAGATRDTGLIPGLERSLGEENGNPLQYSCLENSVNRGAWQATVHRVAKSRTWLKRLGKHTQLSWTDWIKTDMLFALWSSQNKFLPSLLLSPSAPRIAHSPGPGMRKHTEQRHSRGPTT